MPHSTPDFRFRSQLKERMDDPCSREVLRANLRDIARTNRWTLAYRPLLQWLDSLHPALATSSQPLHILDVGCGYGDSLRRIERWSARNGLAVRLTGLDINPDAALIAAEATPLASRIHWVHSDIFAHLPAQPYDLVVSSLFTHHLQEGDIVRFIQWMERHARIGWFINDLHRARLPYHFFRIFSKAAGLHPHVQYDGPVSIARSFIPDDWRSMCAAAGLGGEEVAIRTIRPARLCVARRKTR